MSTAEAVDIAWILIAAALVMLMQAGFTALESGLVRTKNSINVAAKNFADFLVSTAVYWLVGFAIMFGASEAGLFGTSSFLFESDSPRLVAFFIFQVGFVAAAVTIVSGAVAERMRFSSYLIIALVMSALLYPVFGHWAWAGAGGAGDPGWLEALGFIDFAGSTVVHSVGGWMALAAVLLIGPRIGRFGPNAVPIRGHDLPLVTVGVFILWFGWFGFNGGSTLGLTEDVPSVILNTTISAAFGGLTTLLISWLRDARPDAPTIMNGALAGLVGITASANIVSTPQAVVIGTVAGLIMFGVTRLLERLRIDDAVGAVPVHLSAGIWGTLAVAVFGSIEAFGGASRLEQLGYQVVGIGAAFVWVFGLGFVILKLIDRFHPLRIDPEGERQGLNVAEHGASTELVDLLTSMEVQQATGDYSQPVAVEPNTEVGQIATQYNRVLAGIDRETREREAAVVALTERTRSLELLERVTTAVNDEPDLESAYRIVMAEVCTYAGWPVAHAWTVSDDGSSLSPTGLWQGDDPADFAGFMARTEAATFAADEGFPGAAVRAGRPVRLSEAITDDRLSAGEGETRIRSGLALPVKAGPDVVAVLEFLGADEDGPANAQMLALMTAIGTQLGRAVERRRADEARFRAVVDNMPANVFLRDLEGRFVLVNQRYEEFYGLSGEAVAGRTLHELEQTADSGVQADIFAAQDAEVLAQNRTIEYEIETELEGRTYFLSSVKFPIPDATGAAVALGGIETDISEHRQHEAELAELVEKVEIARDEAMNASEAKSQFLANMSHELRTPLNAIIGFTRIVSRKTDGQIEQKQSDNLHKILDSAQRLMALINDILDLSRIESGRSEVYPSVVVLEELLTEVVGSLESIAGARGLELAYDIDRDLESIFTDEEKLRQILINLVGNALKFTEQGSVTLRAASIGDRVRIDVEDTGIGVPDDQQARIFEEFQQADGGTTRRYGGTGLGLAISARLARLLGGTISVESRDGNGSTFTLDLPQQLPRREGDEDQTLIDAARDAAG